MDLSTNRFVKPAVAITLFALLALSLWYFWPAQQAAHNNAHAVPDKTTNQTTSTEKPQHQPTKKAPIPDKKTTQAKPTTKAISEVVSIEQCRNHFLLNDDIGKDGLLGDSAKTWANATRAKLKAHIDSLRAQGIDERFLDILYAQAGLRVSQARRWFDDDPSQIYKADFALSSSVFAGRSISGFVGSQVKKGEFDKIIEKINNKTINPQQLHMAGYDTVSLLGYMLHSLPSENKAEQSELLITQLLNNNYPWQYEDLAAMTVANIPVSLVEQVLSQSKLSVNQTFDIHQRRTSLALLAMHSGNFELTKFFADNGSPFNPDLFYDNGMDVLASTAKHFSQPQRDALFAMIAQKDIRPTRHASVDKLKDQISSQAQMPFAENLQLVQDRKPRFSEDLQSQVAPWVSTLLGLVMENQTDLNWQTEPKPPCYGVLSKWLIEMAMHGAKPLSEDERKQQVADWQHAWKDRQSQETVSDMLIDKAKRLYSEPADILDHLSQDQGFAGKNATDKYRSDLARKRRESLAEQYAKNPQKPKAAWTREEMKVLRLVRLERWQAALSRLAKIPQPSKHLLDSVFYDALTAKQDRVPLIQALMAKGATVPILTVQYLIFEDDVQMAEWLLPMGLKIPTFEQSPRLLYYCIKRKADKLLAFLVRHGVPPDSEKPGLDALDEALQQFRFGQGKVQRVRHLLTTGAQIELSHRQIVNMLKGADPQAYAQLVNAIPELG